MPALLAGIMKSISTPAILAVEDEQINMSHSKHQRLSFSRQTPWHWSMIKYLEAVISLPLVTNESPMDMGKTTYTEEGRV